MDKAVQVIIEGEFPNLVVDTTIIKAQLFELMQLARNEWIRLAQNNLKATAADYVGGIQTRGDGGRLRFDHIDGMAPERS